MTRRPRPPAQGGLWGRQEPLPTGTTPRRAAINDMDLVASVIASAQEPGYIVIGTSKRVFLRDHALKGHVLTVPRYEAETVAQLLDHGHLRLGGTHIVTDGRHEGPARSVLVPAPTRATATRWAVLTPLPGTRLSGNRLRGGRS